MSKRRAVILAVTVEGLTQAETARRYEASETFVSRLLARYRTEGDAAFEPRSRGRCAHRRGCPTARSSSS
jgi:transposase